MTSGYKCVGIDFNNHSERCVGPLELYGWIVAASVLALMSIIMFGYVLGSWRYPTISKNVGIDFNQTTWMFMAT